MQPRRGVVTATLLLAAGLTGCADQATESRVSTNQSPGSPATASTQVGALHSLRTAPRVAPDVTTADAEGRQHELPLIAQKWLTGGQVEVVRPSLPVTWPAPVALSFSELSLSLRTDSPPAFVEVSVWAGGVAASGAPVREPARVVKFSRSPNPGHQLITAQGGIVPLSVKLPPGRVFHVAIWASWPVPEPDWRRQGLTEAPGDSHATWWTVAQVDG